MRRLLILVTALLLCIAGAGLASAAAGPKVHRSSAASAVSSLPATVPDGPSTVTFPGRPVTSSPLTGASPLASAVADEVTAAARVNQATQAVLPDSQVGFEVFDRTTGSILASENADQQVASMSVVKLLIALDVLASDNGAAPDAGTQQQLHQMLANSDDQIASDLWTAGGGPAIVTRMVSLLRLTGTGAPGDPGQWGDTKTTPQDMVTVYRYIADQLPKRSQDLILGALSEAPKVAADGFDQYFGIPEGMPNASWAIKQGWGTSGSQAVMNSTGLVGPEWRYVVIVLGTAPANSYATLPAVVTAAAGALADSVQATVS
jgi:beta-lactamase class A